MVRTLILHLHPGCFFWNQTSPMDHHGSFKTFQTTFSQEKNPAKLGQFFVTFFRPMFFFWNVKKSLDPSKPSKQHLFLNLGEKNTSGFFIGMSGKLNFHEFPPSQTLSLIFDTKLSSHLSGDHLGLLCLCGSHGIT